MEKMTCCFAGCRQECFSNWPDGELLGKPSLRDVLKREIERLIVDEKVTNFLSGLILGPDLTCAELVLELRKKYRHIKLECAVPYEEQAIHWTTSQREIYYNIIEACDRLVQLQTAYTTACLKRHTQYLVDRSGHVLVVWDGTWRGKTGQVMLEARKRGRHIITVDPVTMKINQLNNAYRE